MVCRSTTFTNRVFAKSSWFRSYGWTNLGFQTYFGGRIEISNLVNRGRPTSAAGRRVASRWLACVPRRLDRSSWSPEALPTPSPTPSLTPSLAPWPLLRSVERARHGRPGRAPWPRAEQAPTAGHPRVPSVFFAAPPSYRNRTHLAQPVTSDRHARAEPATIAGKSSSVAAILARPLSLLHPS